MPVQAIKIIRSAELNTMRWAGGSTTQLCIYPPGAEYASRDFLFRISTATVEKEESDFTALPGFSRHLMVLAGEITIRHKGHYEKRLKRFEQDEFDGGWETSAKGQVTDFNLMLASGVSGSLHHLALAEDKEWSPDFNALAFIYIYEGRVRLSGEESGLVHEKDTIVIKSGARVRMHAERDTHLIIAEVQLRD